MGQRLTNFDIKIIILLIFLMLFKNIYNIFTIQSNIGDDYSDIEKLFGDKHGYSVYNIINIITATIFLSSSIYFLISNKIQNLLFAAFCLFMFWRGSVFFIFNFVPGFTDFVGDKVIYYNMQIISILTIFFTIYLIKLILIG